jgi:hypothetical protein
MSVPLLRQSIAKQLLKCPFLGHYYHPDLGGHQTTDSKAKQDGRLFEDLICGKLDGVHVIDADSYRTNAAQEARDAVLAQGGNPVLATAFDSIMATATTIRARIDALLEQNGIPAIADCEQQTELVWESDGVACGGRTDLLHIGANDYTIVDLKKMADIDPEGIQRAIHKWGFDIQRAAYCEGVEKTYPKLAGRGQFVFVGYQISEPYFVVPFTLQGDWESVGKFKWDLAKKVWAKCLAANDWPDYADQYGGMMSIGAKPWQLDCLEGEDVL